MGTTGKQHTQKNGAFVLLAAMILSACGPTEALSADELSEVSGVTQELTVPPAGVGFVSDGVGRLKNGTGTCAYRNGTKFDSAACANTISQQFVFYKMSDSRYQLCAPETLAYFKEQRWMRFFGNEFVPYTVQGYRATCLYRESDEKLLFKLTVLSESVQNSNGSFGSYASVSGPVGLEEKLAAGWILGWSGSTRKITKLSGGIGLASKTGRLDQQWSVY